jgi:hypothetical protein
MKRKPGEFYVARSNIPNAHYKLFRQKPRFYGGICQSDFILNFCPEQFEKEFPDILIPCGKCKLVQFTAKIVRSKK